MYSFRAFSVLADVASLGNVVTSDCIGWLRALDDLSSSGNADNLRVSAAAASARHATAGPPDDLVAKKAATRPPVANLGALASPTLDWDAAR